MTTSPRNLIQAPIQKGYDQVVDYIRRQLMDGLLKAGDRLLPERELAPRLNISRPVLREALRSLAAIGVLDIRQGSGTFVSVPDFSTLGTLFTFMLSQQTGAFDDILEVRIALERQAIRFACVRSRLHDLAKIEAALEKIVATIDDPDEGGKADFHFHTMLVEASHSAALIEIYGVISALLEGNHIARRKRLSMTDGDKKLLISDHRQILRAIRERDVARSDALLLKHFEIGGHQK